MSDRAIDRETRQDAIDWLEGIRDDYLRVSVSPDVLGATKALDLLNRYDSRESTAIGMLTAGRPHDEIRAFLLTGEVSA